RRTRGAAAHRKENSSGNSERRGHVHRRRRRWFWCAASQATKRKIAKMNWAERSVRRGSHQRKSRFFPLFTTKAVVTNGVTGLRANLQVHDHCRANEQPPLLRPTTALY